MSYRGTEIRFNDFSGGLVTNRPITELDTNEMSDLDNVVVFPKGRGFRSRYGDTEFNGTAMNSGANVQGLGYYKQDGGSEYLLAVCGAKLYSSTSALVGTMTEITGAITISAGQDKVWDIFTFNNNSIGFGGAATSPDAPWRWTGTGNAAALGGTPPSAYGGFQANNRVFAFRTSANPSRIYWSILGNEADWTGTGSGSSDVWTSDNDKLTAAAVLNTNTVLLFKENSVHQMQIGNLVDSAFPIFPLFDGVGCSGKHALVVVEGLCYFITNQGRMKVTDGSTIYDEGELPALSNIDDLWNGTNSSRLQYVQGIHKVGLDYSHIIWLVSYGTSQTTHNRAFIWDLLNKCWLKNTTGFKSNVMATTQLGVLYGGHYNGKIYKKDSSTSTATDASESSAVVDGFIVSGWIHNGKFEPIKQPRKMNLSFDTQTDGNIRIFYGFDFRGFLQSPVIDQASLGTGTWGTMIWGSGTWGQVDFNMKPIRIVGRGNFFQYKIETPTQAYPMVIHGFTLSGKEYGQKEIVAS